MKQSTENSKTQNGQNVQAQASPCEGDSPNPENKEILETQNSSVEQGVALPRSCSASEVVQPCGCVGLNTCPLCENRQVTQAELNEFFTFVGGIADKMKECVDEMAIKEALKRFSQEEIDELRKGDPEDFRSAILARLVEEEKALELLLQNEKNGLGKLDVEESY